jgi:Domain of unknown function (DUF1876)
MGDTKRWNVDIVIDERGATTRAEARLISDEVAALSGEGMARRSPHDADIPEIGDEIAAARALSALAHRLLHVAAEDIEGVTHQPAHLHR